MPHPVVQIYFWISMVFAVQILHGHALLLLAGILIVFALKLCAVRFMLLLRRTRWILISIFFIYAYTGSGASLWPQLGIFSPAAAGMVDGSVQILRLLAVLAGLSVLLTSLTQAQLVSGLYTLFYPLRFLGLSRESIAVRLALTLHYAEGAMLGKDSKWRDNLEQMLKPAQVDDGVIELKLVRLTCLDWLLLAGSAAVFIGLLI